MGPEARSAYLEHVNEVVQAAQRSHVDRLEKLEEQGCDLDVLTEVLREGVLDARYGSQNAILALVERLHSPEQQDKPYTAIVFTTQGRNRAYAGSRDYMNDCVVVILKGAPVIEYATEVDGRALISISGTDGTSRISQTGISEEAIAIAKQYEMTTQGITEGRAIAQSADGFDVLEAVDSEQLLQLVMIYSEGRGANTLALMDNLESWADAEKEIAAS